MDSLKKIFLFSVANLMERTTFYAQGTPSICQGKCDLLRCWSILNLKMAEVVFANLSLFERMCNKIACLVYSRTEGDKDVLSQILDSLNSVDYNVFHIKNEVSAVTQSSLTLALST